ncbi:MAG: hypothetical protein ISR87_10550 [Candidatus Marinimicrobia bacterium]|nr:hypothetical protein [FCB group bacterium]MBL7025885.1 hypothetical protein [Candidatus Neomarinimicrobiota bacterium]
MLKYFNVHILTMLLFTLVSSQAKAWELHTLIAQPIFSSMEEVVSAEDVVVTSLEEFLILAELYLEETLQEEEAWAVANLEFYAPLPDSLTFRANYDVETVRQRFAQAIRINPESKFISYLQLMPGAESGSRAILVPEDVTPLKENSGFYNVTFVELKPGERIDPLSVLVSANHEPDLGLDIGLYENNGTEWGEAYKMGTQPFGDAKLEYGSQAPVHMGLYHEAALINMVAPFIKECYPEYRIHLYKTLSELAFSLGHDYWGWRFMGWGLHYLADLTQPYHARALPGVGTIKMIIMNVMDMTGRSRMKDEAIQMVSNRHMAIELLQRQLLERAYLENDMEYLQIKTLASQRTIPHYMDMLPREIITRKAASRSRKLDKIIARNFPEQLVSDPNYELESFAQKNELIDVLNNSGNPEALQNLEQELNDILIDFSVYGRSYARSIISQTP